MDKSIDFNSVRENTKRYFIEQLKNSSVLAWLVEHRNNGSVGCIALSFYQLPPKPKNPNGRYGYLFNLYVDSKHRKKGLARRLMNTAIEYSKSVRVDYITLHASEMGKPLFLKFGFKESNEMTFK